VSFFINATKNRKKQKLIFLVTAIFLAAGLVGSTLIGVFGSRQQENATAAQAPQSISEKVAELENQVEENPDDAAILARLAQAYYQNDQVDKSLETYQKALNIDPGNSDFRTSLATTYFLENQFDKAVAEMKNEIKNNPDNDEAHYYLGVFLAYGQGKYSQGIEELKVFVDEADAEANAVELAKAKQMIEEIQNMDK